MDGTITIKIGIATWGVSFCIGLICGTILRVSLFFHTFLGAVLLGWQIGRQGLSDYVATLAGNWVIGVIVILGMLPGYAYGYFAADALCKRIAEAWD